MGDSIEDGRFAWITVAVNFPAIHYSYIPMFELLMVKWRRREPLMSIREHLMAVCPRQLPAAKERPDALLTHHAFYGDAQLDVKKELKNQVRRPI